MLLSMTLLTAPLLMPDMLDQVAQVCNRFIQYSMQHLDSEVYEDF